MDNIYLNNGYYDVPRVIQKCAENNVQFCPVIGGRAIGKTYGFLKEMVLRNELFIYARRTQTEIDVLMQSDTFNPFKKLNHDLGWDIYPIKQGKYIGVFYHCGIDENNKLIPHGNPVGILCAITSMAKMRGFDASDVKTIVYDEFIPEQHVNKIRGEGLAILNFYETINRNRELEGEKAVTMFMLANSNYLANPFFMELKIVNTAEKLQLSDKCELLIPKKHILLVICKNSPISSRKAKTGLYEMVGENSEMGKMSLSNRFSDQDAIRCKVRPLRELVPVVQVGELMIYQHKYDGRYYASRKISGAPSDVYGIDLYSIEQFKRKYRLIHCAYLDGLFDFEDYYSFSLLSELF